MLQQKPADSVASRTQASSSVPPPLPAAARGARARWVKTPPPPALGPSIAPANDAHAADVREANPERRLPPRPEPRVPAAPASPLDLSGVVDLSRRPPKPQLLLPIVSTRSSAAPVVIRELDASATPPVAIMPSAVDGAWGVTMTAPGRSARPIPPLVPPQMPLDSVAAHGAGRESRALDLVGFALAWVVTTAAGSLMVGHVIANARPPVVVRVPYPVPATVDTATEHPSGGAIAGAMCPSVPAPPTVAVNDLPPAGKRAASAMRAPSSIDESAAAPAPVAWRAPVRSSGAAVAPHHARTLIDAGAPAPHASAKAKAAPKTLADWMRAAVDPG